MMSEKIRRRKVIVPDHLLKILWSKSWKIKKSFVLIKRIFYTKFSVFCLSLSLHGVKKEGDNLVQMMVYYRPSDWPDCGDPFLWLAITWLWSCPGVCEERGYFNCLIDTLATVFTPQSLVLRTQLNTEQVVSETLYYNTQFEEKWYKVVSYSLFEKVSDLTRLSYSWRWLLIVQHNDQIIIKNVYIMQWWNQRGDGGDYDNILTTSQSSASWILASTLD